MSYISLTQKPIAVKVWEKLRKKNTLNFCIKRILSSYHAKVFHFPRYTSLHSTKQEWVWMWKILEITLDPNINSIYIISLRHAAQTPKAGGSKKKIERRTLEITTKIVEIGLKLPLDRNNMKIFILYQGEIEEKDVPLLPFYLTRQWAIKLKIEIEKFRCASICCFIHIDNK